MTNANDNLAVGTPITYVGYGVTENGGNSTRRKVDKTIGKLDSYFVEYANAQTSGTCQGDSGGPGLVLVNGVDGAGKGETVNLFNEWMDPRHIRTEAFGAMPPEESGRPEMWRFWQVLPPKGHLGILFGSWYTDPILAHVMGHQKRARFAQRLERIRQFERMLVAEGAIVIKCWFHLSKQASRARLKSLAADPKTAWRVTADDWAHLKHYDEFVRVCEKALRKTSTGEAPWLVIDGSDAAYRSLTVGQYLLDALQARLAGQRPAGGTLRARLVIAVQIVIAQHRHGRRRRAW